MEKLERSNAWTPTSSTRRRRLGDADRVPHRARDRLRAREVGGKKVAFTSARTTYFHEADSAIGFFRLNDPSWTRDPESFRRAVDGINFAFNWGYIDSKHIAYQLSGWYPRARQGPRPTSRSSGPAGTTGAATTPTSTRCRRVPLEQAPARGRPDLSRLLEQQAGPRLGRLGRRVRLRAAPPPAADRRPRPPRDPRGRQDEPRGARPVDGGGRHGGHPRPLPCDHPQGDRQAAGRRLRNAIAILKRWRRAARTAATWTRTATTTTTPR